MHVHATLCLSRYLGIFLVARASKEVEIKDTEVMHGSLLRVLWS